MLHNTIASGTSIAQMWHLFTTPGLGSRKRGTKGPVGPHQSPGTGGCLGVNTEVYGEPDRPGRGFASGRRSLPARSGCNRNGGIRRCPGATPAEVFVRDMPARLVGKRRRCYRLGRGRGEDAGTGTRAARAKAVGAGPSSRLERRQSGATKRAGKGQLEACRTLRALISPWAKRHLRPGRRASPVRAAVSAPLNRPERW